LPIQKVALRGVPRLLRHFFRTEEPPEEIHLMIHLPLNEIKEVEASMCATK
jgi:hypothetical protein